MIKKYFKKAIRSTSRIIFEELTNHFSIKNNTINCNRLKPNHLDFLMLNILRNIHLGKRCFIIGNGPSLNIEDIDKIKNEYTFAANKIYLLFNETSWRPTFYSAEDPLLVKSNYDKIEKLKQTTKLFPSHMLQYLKRDSNSYFIPFIPAPNRINPKRKETDREFSLDLVHGINWGSTITYSMIQMAVFMGFRKIYIIGLDHFYIIPGQKSGNKYICEGEKNHFHKDYRKPGELWNDPKIDTLTRSYEYANEICNNIGVKIYNASRKTALNVFKRCKLDEIL